MTPEQLMKQSMDNKRVLTSMCECPECNGRGFYSAAGQVCDVCYGEGEVSPELHIRYEDEKWHFERWSNPHASSTIKPRKGWEYARLYCIHHKNTTYGDKLCSFYIEDEKRVTELPYSNFVQALNAFGADGWEALPDGDGYLLRYNHSKKGQGES